MGWYETDLCACGRDKNVQSPRCAHCAALKKRHGDGWEAHVIPVSQIEPEPTPLHDCRGCGRPMAHEGLCGACSWAASRPERLRRRQERRARA